MLWHIATGAGIGGSLHPAYLIPVWRQRCFPVAIHGRLLVAKISAALLGVIDVATGAEDLLFAAQGDHIRQKSKRDAEAVLKALPEALGNVKYVGRTPGKPNWRHVVGSAAVGKLVFVALKFLPAEKSYTGKDEAWITTAYFIGEREVRRRLGRNKIFPVIGPAA